MNVQFGLRLFTSAKLSAKSESLRNRLDKQMKFLCAFDNVN